MNHNEGSPHSGGYLTLVQIQRALNTPLGDLIDLVRKNDPDYFPCIAEGDKILYSPLALVRMQRLVEGVASKNEGDLEDFGLQLPAAGNLVDLVDHLLAHQAQINSRLRSIYKQIQHPPLQWQKQPRIAKDSENATVVD